MPHKMASDLTWDFRRKLAQLASIYSSALGLVRDEARDFELAAGAVARHFEIAT